MCVFFTCWQLNQQETKYRHPIRVYCSEIESHYSDTFLNTISREAINIHIQIYTTAQNRSCRCFGSKKPVSLLSHLNRSGINKKILFNLIHFEVSLRWHNFVQVAHSPEFLYTLWSLRFKHVYVLVQFLVFFSLWPLDLFTYLCLYRMLIFHNLFHKRNGKFNEILKQFVRFNWTQ